MHLCKCFRNILVYHMTVFLFSGEHHIIKKIMTTCYRTLLVGTSNVTMMSVSTMQILMELNKFLWR